MIQLDFKTGWKNVMNNRKDFRTELLKIAVPVTLQSLLQSSFSVVDQVMTGQLGSASIAGIGLAAKFASLYSLSSVSGSFFSAAFYRLKQRLSGAGNGDLYKGCGGQGDIGGISSDSGNFLSSDVSQRHAGSASSVQRSGSAAAVFRYFVGSAEYDIELYVDFRENGFSCYGR